MSDQVDWLGDDCHFTIEPVWPASVIVVPLPLQTVLADGVATPPTEAGFTVAVVVPAAEAQPLTVTVTRYRPLAEDVTRSTGMGDLFAV